MSRWHRLSTVVAGAAIALTTACGDAPTEQLFDPHRPARLELAAEVRAQTVAGGSAQLVVRSSYVRNDQSRVPLDSQSVVLTDASTQQVPIRLDLAACLADPLRASATGGPPVPSECLVWLDLALVTNGQVVDRNSVRNVPVRPGQTATVGGVLTLDEVGSVRLTPPSENVVAADAPLRLEATRTMVLAAAVLDGAGRPIARAVTFTSSNPSVATVSSAGLVTGLAAGTTRITAAAGARSTFVDVRVAPLPQPLTVAASATSSGSGRVLSEPAGIDCVISGLTVSGACAFNFRGDASVTLRMSTGATTTFVGWGGDCSGTSTCQLVTSQPRTALATLRAFRTLTVAATGAGNGSVTSLDGTINCLWRGGASSGACSAQYPDGTEIVLVATAAAGSEFSSWAGNCSVVNENRCTLRMTSEQNAVALFRPLTTYRITGGTGAGSGVVTSVPAGMACTVSGSATSGTCTLAVPTGTPVTLSAVGSSGSLWRSWLGACAGQNATCSFGQQVSGEQNSTVAFDRPLTVAVSGTGTGNGSLTAAGGVFACFVRSGTSTGLCSTQLAEGTQVTLVATASSGSEFAGWTSCPTAADNRCTFVVGSTTAVVAEFRAVVTYRLTGGLGQGSGVVTSSPAGLNCTVTGGVVSGTCTFTAPLGTAVTVFATGTNDNSFSRWGGACSSQSSPICTVPLPETSTEVGISVAFERQPTLTVNVDALSAGSVQVVGTGGFTCQLTGNSVSTPCQRSYDVGTEITLTANRVGYTDVVGWTGCTSTEGNTCIVTLSANRTVSVYYQTVPTTTLTIRALSGSYAVLVNHSYQAEQRCVRSPADVVANPEFTTCQFVVPLQRTVFVSLDAPTNYVTGAQAPCESQIAARQTCARQFTGPFTFDVFAFISSPPIKRASAPPGGSSRDGTRSPGAER